jgi:hypothetical protein
LGAILGSEKIFGFGSPAASNLPYAELLTEVIRTKGRWIEGSKRVLTNDNIFDLPDNPRSLDTWMNSLSPQQIYKDQK